jgi:hypothetical protein
MRIALLSDIHGNSVALDAVLADIIACSIRARLSLSSICAESIHRAGSPASIHHLAPDRP